MYYCKLQLVQYSASALSSSSSPVTWRLRGLGLVARRHREVGGEGEGLSSSPWKLLGLGGSSFVVARAGVIIVRPY